MANLIDSNRTMLPVEEIVSIAAQNADSPIPPYAIIQGIKAELKQPGTLPIRYGNTLFICHKGKNRVGTFRALNADTARNLVENGMRWVVTVYDDMGFDYMVTQFTEPSFLSVFKAISRRPPRQNMGYQARKLKDGQLQVVLQLGPKREGETK